MTANLKKILFAVCDKTESTVGAQELYLPLSKLLPENGIVSDKEVAEFCAQCAHESGGFRRRIENLNYSAEALARTWKERYSLSDVIGGKVVYSLKPNDLANRIARNPESIANHTYANRIGNGAPDSGDGWKYRGRGIIQLTGRNNYALAQKELGIQCVDNPDMVSGMECAARVAVWFWVRNRCGKAKTFLGQSRIINLGNENSAKTPNGMADRNARLARALAAIE